jgi:NADH-quinone oxidoreductase subunit D
MFESISIIYQAASVFKNIFEYIDINLSTFFTNMQKQKTNTLSNIEQLINNFKKSENFFNNCGFIQYSSVEAGKGEFGVTLLTNIYNKIQRVHLRSPAYNHLQMLARLGQGHMLADIVTLIGSLDIVFGEVDR